MPRLQTAEVPRSEAEWTRRRYPSVQARHLPKAKDGFAPAASKPLLAAVNLNATILFLFRRRSLILFALAHIKFHPRMDALMVWGEKIEIVSSRHSINHFSLVSIPSKKHEIKTYFMSKESPLILLVAF